MTIYKAMAGGVMLMLIGVLVASALYYFIIPTIKTHVQLRRNKFYSINKKMQRRYKENAISTLSIKRKKDV